MAFVAWRGVACAVAFLIVAGCATLPEESLRAEWSRGAQPLADQLIGRVYAAYVVDDPAASDAGRRFVAAVADADDVTAIALWPAIREQLQRSLMADPFYARDVDGQAVLAMQLRNLEQLDSLVLSRAPPAR